MAVTQDKDKTKWTKDGRSWTFRVYYTDINGIRRQHQSIRYKTRKEAEIAERAWLNKENAHSRKRELTFKDLYLLFYDFQKTRVKETTYVTYMDRAIYLEPLDNVKLSEFSMKHYEYWRNWIDGKNISTAYKNDIQKFLKAILNYGTKIHKYNFNDVYPNMTKFQSEDEEPKEMDFYTIDEFNRFIKNVPDLKYRCLFKTLFYCGLRNGEMRGLRWSRVDWEHGQLKILKQIPTRYSSRYFKETTLKTNGSRRTIPIAKTLMEDLREFYNEQKSRYVNFSNEWFIFGDILPIVADNPSAYQKQICRHIDLKVIRIHDFRHSCASFLISNGADILTVSKFLGHTKVSETLNTYAHMYKDKLNDIINITDKISEVEEKKENNSNNDIVDALNQLITNAINSGQIDASILRDKLLIK